MNYLYLSAVNYFAQYTADFKVDVEMSAHGWVDDTFARLEKLKHRRPGQPHPRSCRTSERTSRGLPN